jgi:hypothetical protein
MEGKNKNLNKFLNFRQFFNFVTTLDKTLNFLVTRLTNVFENITAVDRDNETKTDRCRWKIFVT